jgi:predicted TIM-barrel fold metal-dependent hydrolase
MAMDTPNVYCESGWCFQSRIVEFARQLPRDKIVFGTDTPPNEPGMWLRELEMLCGPAPQGMDLDEDGLEDYMGNNIARLVGIEPSPPPRNLDEAELRLKDSYAKVNDVVA